MTISDAIIEITRLQVCAVVNFRSEDKLQTIQTYNSFKNNTIISLKYLLDLNSPSQHDTAIKLITEHLRFRHPV